jgi:hypothetical protein
MPGPCGLALPSRRYVFPGQTAHTHPAAARGLAALPRGNEEGRMPIRLIDKKGKHRARARDAAPGAGALPQENATPARHPYRSFAPAAAVGRALPCPPPTQRESGVRGATRPTVMGVICPVSDGLVTVNRPVAAWGGSNRIKPNRTKSDQIKPPGGAMIGGVRTRRAMPAPRGAGSAEEPLRPPHASA